jgi:hypothetical protein
VNSLPLPRPSLCASSVPLVHLGQAARQGQPDAQAALRAAAVAVAAAEHLEHARHGGGRDAHAGVFHADALRGLPRRTRTVTGRRRRVLRGVVQQVGEHLRQPHRVAFHPERPGGSSTTSTWPGLLHQRVAGLHRVPDDGGHLDGLACAATACRG